MKNFLIELLIIMILQTISRFIIGLLGIQWDLTNYIIGAMSGLLYIYIKQIMSEYIKIQ